MSCTPVRAAMATLAEPRAWAVTMAPCLSASSDRGRQHLVVHVDVLRGELGDDAVAGDEQLERADAQVALAGDDLA